LAFGRTASYFNTNNVLPASLADQQARRSPGHGGNVKRSKHLSARKNRSTVAAHVHSVLRHSGLATVSAVSMATMLSAPAWADADAPADDTATLQEVIVTGIRYQLETSQQRKQAPTRTSARPMVTR